jgi:hypothetical protein
LIFIGYTIARLRSVRRLIYREGVKMLIHGKNKHLLDASRRRKFHGEVASKWFGSYSLSGFSGIILTSSPYPLKLIKGEELSWRKLAFWISLDWIELWRLLAWLDEPLCQDIM